MPAFTTRFDDPLVAALDRLAAQHRLSRNALLEKLAEQAVRRGFVPLQPGEGFEARSEDGKGELSLVQEYNFVASGHTGLDEEGLRVFEEARSLAQQGLWHRARQRLTEAGFAVSNITR